ncbi:MAG: hypothetical protein R2684_03815 [Pyrinomonadaceae bacterium]
MKIEELREKLLKEDVDKVHINILTTGDGDDRFCIDRNGDCWEVFFVERGIRREPEFSSEIESEACQYYFDLITSMENFYLAGRFTEERFAIRLHEDLLEKGFKAVRNDLPESMGLNSRFRVFVIGRSDSVLAKAINGAPLTDSDFASATFKD